MGDKDEQYMHEINRLEGERDHWKNRCQQMQAGIIAVRDLMAESRGVVGLHLNYDEAPWDELRTGGRFEEWLFDFDTAVDLVITEKEKE